MMPLYEQAPKSLWYDGKCYEINNSFGAVLKIFDIFDEEDLLEEQQLDAINDILFYGKLQTKDVTGAFNSFLEINEMKNDTNGKKEDPIIDFNQDAEYIFAAFLSVYNINLREQANSLSWVDFIALFKSLPSDTKISEIMRIRSEPLPRLTSKNKKQYGDLLLAKQKFKIKKKDDKESFQRDLLKAFLPLFENGKKD